MYAKYSKKLGGERYCTSCFKKAEVESVISSISDLPEFVKKYVRMWNNSPNDNDIIIVFPYPSEITEADVNKIPLVKKFIKINGGGYDDRGHWYIPISQGSGWHGDTPGHVAAARKHELSRTLRTPMAKKEFTLAEARQIGSILNVDWSKTPVEEFLVGLNIELEHGRRNPATNITNDDPILTGKIVLAHITEYPRYNNDKTGLPAMERGLEGN